MTSLDDFGKMDTPVTMNQLKFLQGLYEPLLLQRVVADMSRPKTNIKEIQDRASAYQKQQWIYWHWGAAPDSVIHPTRSMFPLQASRQRRKQGKRNLSHVYRGESGREGTCDELCPAGGCPHPDRDPVAYEASRACRNKGFYGLEKFCFILKFLFVIQGSLYGLIMKDFDNFKE